MYNVVLAIYVGTRWRLERCCVALHYGTVLGKKFSPSLLRNFVNSQARKEVIVSVP